MFFSAIRPGWVSESELWETTAKGHHGTMYDFVRVAQTTFVKLREVSSL